MCKFERCRCEFGLFNNKNTRIDQREGTGITEKNENKNKRDQI